MESLSPGLLKNGKMNLCMSTGSRENKQNKVRTQLWDTLYMAVKSDMSCGHGRAEEFCPPPLYGAVSSPPESKKPRMNVSPGIKYALRAIVRM